MKRILVVAPDFPYPTTDGARVDIWTRVRTLKKLGLAVDLVATVKSPPHEAARSYVKTEVDKIYTVQRNRSWQSAVSLQPFQAASRAGLSKIRLSSHYDAVLLESEFVGDILENDSLSADLLLLRVHNDSAHNFAQLAASERNIPKWLFYLTESLKARRYFRRVSACCNQLWFVSSIEHEAYQRSHNSARITTFFLPPHIDPDGFSISPRMTPHALFLGTLGLAPNAEAVLWYLKEVHEKLRDIPHYGLDVAGNTLGSSIPSLHKAASAFPNVFIYENPEIVDGLHSQASVFVNPVLHGSGVKQKTIRAIECGLPVVSTTVGAEGTGLVHGEHILIADSGEEFAKCVREVLLNPELALRMVRNAQDFLRRNYDQLDTMRHLLNLDNNEEHGDASQCASG